VVEAYLSYIPPLTRIISPLLTSSNNTRLTPWYYRPASWRARAGAPRRVPRC